MVREVELNWPFPYPILPPPWQPPPVSTDDEAQMPLTRAVEAKLGRVFVANLTQQLARDEREEQAAARQRERVRAPARVDRFSIEQYPEGGQGGVARARSSGRVGAARAAAQAGLSPVASSATRRVCSSHRKRGVSPFCAGSREAGLLTSSQSVEGCRLCYLSPRRGDATTPDC
jgi:hypothetical protein